MHCGLDKVAGAPPPIFAGSDHSQSSSVPPRRLSHRCSASEPNAFGARDVTVVLGARRAGRPQMRAHKVMLHIGPSGVRSLKEGMADQLGSYSIRDAKSVGPNPCNETGTLVSKGQCYALRCEDGVEMWLEIDPIPLHLIDQQVRIAGLRYSPNLILVAGIGPI